ncbi:MAG: protein translocase subunit SecF [Candidatus Limnocylindrales bacterium]
MIDIIGKRRYGYILSGVLTLVGAIFILATLIPNGNVGLQFSIAYTGGTVWEVGFEEGTPDPNDVRAVLEEVGLTGEVAITEANDTEYVLIRTEALSLQAPEVVEGSAAAAVAAERSAEPEPAEATEEPVLTTEGTAAPVPTEASVASAEPSATDGPADTAAPSESATPAETTDAEATAPADAQATPPADAEVPPAVGGDAGGSGPTLPTDGTFGELAAALQAEFGPINEVRQENSVGPVVSQELVYQTFLLVLIAAGAIMIWVGYRFRDFRMGVAALLALLHDVVIVVGLFAVLGTIIGLQVDGLFVTAMLTVIGYSVHDTIVVFDRIRENRQRFLGEPLEQIANHSLVQTVGRSLTTSLTLVVTLLALLLFGGEAIRPFTFALLIGVVAGTYSSIFVATPLFLDWHLWADKRKADRPAEAEPETIGA